MADLSAYPRIHLVGVGGAGMSALAKLLAGKGHLVTGSDLRPSLALAALADIGLDVWDGHRPEQMQEAGLVVASSAVPESDPEIKAAKAAGVPVWRRPDLLDAVTSMIPTIGPTGTHGKTSSTGMMVAALRATGMDPSFVVGGDLIDLRTNALAGADDLLVLEVDEAFGTFERINLKGLQVTSVEPEHLDHFGTFAQLEAAFLRVMRSVDGPVVACMDDPGAARLAEMTKALTYGIEEGADYRILEFVPSPGSVAFRLEGRGAATDVLVPRPGIHMARNAAGVLSLLHALGHDLMPAAAGLRSFHGVRRRFEHRGTVDGVTMVDDYAHHPTEVAATLRAARHSVPSRLVAVFQPHLYSRTEMLHREFGAALALADLVVVTDVYAAREVPQPGVTGRLVADAATRAGSAGVRYVPHRADLAGVLAELCRPGDLVVTMGAGDVTTVSAELIAELTA